MAQLDYALAAMELLLATWTLSLSLCLAIRVHRHTQSLNKSVTFLALSVLLCLALSSTFHAAIYLFPSSPNAVLLCYIVSYTLGFNVCAYLYFLALIYHSFKDSCYAISSRTIALHAAIAMTVSLSTSISLYLQETGQFGHFKATFIAAEVALYILGLLHLGYLLNRKLILLAILHENVGAMSRVQTDLLSTTTKVSVLLSTASAAVAGYVSVCIATAIWGHNFHHGEPREVAMVEVVTMTSYVAVAMVGTLCIFLMFKVNHIEYRTLCSCCDAQCLVLCHWVAANQCVPRTVVRMAMTASNERIERRPNTLNAVERSEGMEMETESQIDFESNVNPKMLPMPLEAVPSVSSPSSPYSSGDLDESYAIV